MSQSFLLRQSATLSSVSRLGRQTAGAASCRKRVSCLFCFAANSLGIRRLSSKAVSFSPSSPRNPLDSLPTNPAVFPLQQIIAPSQSLKHKALKFHNMGYVSLSKSLCRATEEQGVGTPGSIADKRLILYSKPGCHLCDGLKEKLDVAFTTAGEHSISGVELEVRNILDKEEWEQAYRYEIPVLTWSRKGSDNETAIPRFSPRTSVDRMQKQLHDILRS